MSIKYFTAFHIIGLTHHTFTIIYSKTQLDFSAITNEKVLDINRYDFRYFTTWNLIMQFIYLIVALTHDILTINEKNISPKLVKKISKIRGYLFSTFIFPCTMMVFSLFWTLFWINRDFVLPKEADEVLPGWINHNIHTNILILLIGELMIPNMQKPSAKDSFTGLTILIFAYSVCYFGTYFQTGRWLYGIYDILTWPQRIAFMLINYLITLVFYQTGISIQNCISHVISINTKRQYSKILTTEARKIL